MLRQTHNIRDGSSVPHPSLPHSMGEGEEGVQARREARGQGLEGRAVFSIGCLRHLPLATRLSPESSRLRQKHA